MCLTLLTAALLCVQPSTTATHASPFDALVAELQVMGVKVERPRAVVYFDSTLLTPRERERWADLISDGVTHIEQFVGLPFSRDRLEYYVSGRQAITSYALDGTPPRVLLASDRVRRGAAPYLYEAAHHLLFQHTPRRTPGLQHLWLIEGFASYVEDAVAARFGGVPGRVFARSGNDGIDAEARDALRMPRGQEVLAYVGRAGMPDGLSDRDNVARPYYVLAQSLTKHLIEAVGLATFVEVLLPHLLHAERLESEIARLCATSLERVTSEWRNRLEAAGARGAR